MRPFGLGTFSIAGCPPFAGMVLDGAVIALSGLGVEDMPHDILGLLERWNASLPRLTDAADRWAAGERDLRERAVPVEQLRVHAPLQPRQIFGVGANYRRHVVEMVMGEPDLSPTGNGPALSEAERRDAAERLMDERARSAAPYCFIKLPTSVAGPYDRLEIPASAAKVDWECELAVVIGRAARHVAAPDAAAYVAGYMIANDVTARDLVFRRDVPALGTDWLSAKSQPGFTPLGPYLTPASFIDPYQLTISLSVNGRVMQDERSSDMLIRIDRQIEYLSSRVRLLPGDVICTGSPAGNGAHHGVYLKAGDRMVSTITGLGEQRTTCVGAAP